MTTFVATDGTRIEFVALPTLKSVTELFNYVYEREIADRGRGEGAPVKEAPLCDSGSGESAGTADGRVAQ